MKINILYFAALREERQCSSESKFLDHEISVQTLFEQIFLRPPSGIRFAINQSYVDGNTLLQDGDEVAFLPPVTGG